jgi:hypothetical protein
MNVINNLDNTKLKTIQTTFHAIQVLKADRKNINDEITSSIDKCISATGIAKDEIKDWLSISAKVASGKGRPMHLELLTKIEAGFTTDNRAKMEELNTDVKGYKEEKKLMSAEITAEVNKCAAEVFLKKDAIKEFFKLMEMDAKGVNVDAHNEVLQRVKSI